MPKAAQDALAAAILAEVSADAAADDTAGFETYVVGQWIRWRDWSSPSSALWFWQDRSGAEVDLLIERDAKLFAIECKLASRPTPGEPKGFAKLRELYGDAVARTWIACTTAQPHELAPGVEARSGWTVWPLP